MSWLKRVSRAYRMIKSFTSCPPDMGQPAAESSERIRHKSWAIEYPVSDEELDHAEFFAQNAAAVFLLMRPFNDFLNQALEGFHMPERG